MGLLKDKTNDNLQKLLDRDEKFDNLLEKADHMQDVTIKMKKKTVQVKRKAIWSGIGFKLLMIFVSLVRLILTFRC